jgi:hypothetical protein
LTSPLIDFRRENWPHKASLTHFSPIQADRQKNLPGQRERRSRLLLFGCFNHSSQALDVV